MGLILVTGAHGQLGRSLRAVAPGWMFVGRRELDVTSQEAVGSFFAVHRPSVVINCAAFTDVDRAETEREAAMAVNRDGAGNLAEACRAADAALVHISTDFVFSGAAAKPYTEADVPSPVNFYGASKLAGERAVEASGCRGAIVRTSWLWSGGAQDGAFRQAQDGAFRQAQDGGFPAAILRRAAASREIRVVADQVGTPTAAVSLAAALSKVVAAPLSAPAELYHFCDGPVLSRAEWARAIIRDAGLDCRVVEVSSDEFPTAAARPHFSALDPTKFCQKYGR